MPRFDALAPKGCRYALTADAPFIFCGREQLPGKSYCPRHHAICVRETVSLEEEFADVLNARDGILKSSRRSERAVPLDKVLK